MCNACDVKVAALKRNRSNIVITVAIALAIVLFMLAVAAMSNCSHVKTRSVTWYSDGGREMGRWQGDILLQRTQDGATFTVNGEEVEVIGGLIIVEEP